MEHRKQSVKSPTFVPMMRWLLILFSLHFLSGNILIGEASKTVLLVKHYQEHQQQNHNITLLGFLQLHYQDQQHEHADPTHHDKIPFHGCSINIGFAFFERPEAPLLPTAHFLLPDNEQQPLRNSDLLPCLWQCSIFQPPRA